MTSEDVGEMRGIAVGDSVVYVPDDGFHAGKRFKKTVARIIRTTWTAAEAAELHVPMMERTICFDDGTIADTYSGVYKS